MRTLMAIIKRDKVTGLNTKKDGEGQSTATAKATIMSIIAMIKTGSTIHATLISINVEMVRTSMDTRENRGTLKSI